jgi:hypothetical protein
MFATGSPAMSPAIDVSDNIIFCYNVATRFSGGVADEVSDELYLFFR